MQEVNYTRTLFKSFMEESEENLANEFFDSSYVKFLEQAGARVVPIFIQRDEAYYRRMFNLTNGLLVPGGAANLAESGVLASFILIALSILDSLMDEIVNQSVKVCT